MAHAHPSPNRFLYHDENNQTSLRPRPLFHAQANPTPPPVSPIDPAARDKNTPFGLQNRRLQLRNINFRGSILPSRRLSNQISKWTAGALQTDKSAQKENSAGTTRRRPTTTAVHDEVSPSSSGSILQEINNSSRQLRHSPHRPSIANIFEDSPPEDPLPDRDISPTSWYREASHHSTPIALDGENTLSTMKQRSEDCPARSPPPLSSPLAKQIRGRKKSRMNLRNASYEQSKYIEHLESQLAVALGKVDSLTSPSTTRGPVGKLRTITAENNCLKQELADWEKNFKDRLEDAVGKKIELESSLRGRIRSLEHEAESKDRKIKELEWELERASLRLSEMDSVEATNRSLERRLDVLTELLAQSPTRPTHPLERTSPFRLKTTRPKSMMPIMPSSADAVALSRRQSTAYADSSTKISQSEANSPTHHLTSRDLRAEFMPQKKMLSDEIGSLDSGLGESCSVSSVLTSGSRPVSYLSDSSTSPSAWGLPLPGLTSPELRSRQGTRNRKMRKFPSGSASLKPLILPTASATSAAMSIPASAPVLPSYATPSRDVSGQSIDPTTSFLSKHSYDSLFDTPTQLRRSSTWAEEDTLRILEGSYEPLNQMESLDSALSTLSCQDITCFDPDASHTLTDSLEQAMETEYASSPPADVVEPSFEAEIEEYLHERSLREAEAKSKALSSTAEESTAETMAEPEPANCADSDAEEAAYNDDLAAFTEFATITAPPETPDSNTIRQRRRPSYLNFTPVPPKTPKSRPRPQTPPTKSSPVVSLVPTTVFGSISRYTSYFKEIRKDPTALVRRIIANAWCSNWSRLGRLSWWVLGLFLGAAVREDWPAKSAADDDFNWHYYSADASKARRAGSMVSGSSEGEGRSLANGEQRARSSPPKKATFDDDVLLERVKCNECVEQSSSFGRSIRLWAKFSFALVLAVGVAVKDGPEVVLADTTRARRREGNSNDNRKQRAISPLLSPSESIAHVQDYGDPQSIEAMGEETSWGGKLTWIQNLGVKDFSET